MANYDLNNNIKKNCLTQWKKYKRLEITSDLYPNIKDKNILLQNIENKNILF